MTVVRKNKFLGGTSVRMVLRRATTMAANRRAHNGNERKNYKPVTLAGKK